MAEHIKEPCAAIFTGQRGCGKTHLVLDLIEKETFWLYYHICSTLQENSKYHVKEGIKNDDKVWLVEPKENLYQWIQKLSELLRFLDVLFVIDDIIANKDLDRRRQPLWELSISSKHRSHYLWLLTQSYLGIPKKLREQTKAIFIWYQKDRSQDMLTENEIIVVRDFYNQKKICILIYTKWISWWV